MSNTVSAPFKPLWEIELERQYKLDIQRIMDSYKEIDLEFREWWLELIAKEVHTDNGCNECDSDDSLYDDRIPGGEPIWTEPCEANGAEVDPGYAGEGFSEPESTPVTVCIGEDGGEDRFLFPVMEMETINITEADTYENFYEEIDAYKMQNKSRAKKKHYKYKPRKG